MPRPSNKSELTELSSANFDKLTDLIENYSTQKLSIEFPDRYLNRNVRDVLGHLHHWHLMFFEWYRVGIKGERPEMPAKGYTWSMTPKLNEAIQKRYRNIDLTEMVDRLRRSHEKIQNIILKHSDEELFEKQKYVWTGSTSLGQYLISSTSSHYDWAIKLIRKCIG